VIRSFFYVIGIDSRIMSFTTSFEYAFAVSITLKCVETNRAQTPKTAEVGFSLFYDYKYCRVL
jgi:hypothetical protein